MKWFKSKSFFHKVLGYFSVILVVPVCTILLLYMQAEKTVKEQIQISGRNTLNQFASTMDIALEEMEELTSQLVFNENIQQYAMYAVYYPNRSYYQLHTTVRTLEYFDAARYEGIIVYYPYPDLVASAKFRPDEKNIQQKAEFDVIKACDSLKPKLYVLSNDTGKKMLCTAMMRSKVGDSRQNYVAAVMLAADYLERMIASDNALSGVVSIYGGEKELLYSNGIHEVVLPEGEIGSGYSYEVESEGARYMVHVEPSKVASAYFTHAVPYAYYWQQLRITRLIYIIGLLACTIISLIVSYKLCSRAYRPVEAMLDNIQKHSDTRYNRFSNSEFEFIESLFHREREEKFGLKQKAKTGRAAMLERFIIQLFDGNVPEKSVDNIFQENGMILYSDSFCVAVLTVGPNPYEDLLPFILENVFCELVNEKHKGYVVSLPGRRYGILINLRSPLQESEIKELLTQGKTFLNEHGSLILSVGISTVKEGMMQIPVAYKEAEQALSYRYLYGEGCVITYEQVKNKEVRFAVAEESKLFLLLQGYITGAEKQSADCFVEELLAHYRIDKEASMETVNGFLRELISTVRMLLKSREDSSEESSRRVEQLSRTGSLEELKLHMAELLQGLWEKEQSRVIVRDICRKIKRHIEEHFGDKELSLVTISDQFEISSSYISGLFKEAYEVGIPDYIAQTRVRAGKEFLRTTEHSVVDIAKQCGFMSSNVFIKVFKKYEGITPGVYRRLLSGDMEQKGGVTVQLSELLRKGDKNMVKSPII